MYSEHTAESDPQWMGWAVVLVLQFFTLLDLAALSLKYTGLPLVPYLKPFAIAIAVVVFALNIYRYSARSRYRDLGERWSNEEPSTKRYRSIAITLYALVVVALPIIFGPVK